MSGYGHFADCSCVLCQGKAATPEEKFWRYAEPKDGCWGWNGPRNNMGYGRVCCYKVKGVSAHRLSYAIHKGPIPDGLCVLHHCDNPPCCNPAHLFLGTLKDNTRDMYAKGRAKPGLKPRTHCPQGHPYEGDNVRLNCYGIKVCAACLHESRRKQTLARRAKNLATGKARPWNYAERRAVSA